MSRDIQSFIKDYARAVMDGNAAIFAGAGLSKPVGFVDWKNLLRGVAEDLGLDIDKESDLIGVAQYHLNEYGTRGKLNQVLIDEFTRDTRISDTHRVLASLPIRTYWTTNYDHLLEDALKGSGKRFDRKITNENLAYTMPHTDATVYKMHGDISAPNDAVITKDDYERYELTRSLFTTTLKGDLVSKTFLFVGFSFNDPNMDHILSRVRVLLGNSQRQHFCFMKQLSPSDPQFLSKEEYDYAVIRQELRTKDLKRFGIKVLLVQDYSEIPRTLREVSRIVSSQNVLISGSAHAYDPWDATRASEFMANLSAALIRGGFNIVSGFGLGIGSSVITGALEAVYDQREAVSDRIHLRPFPQGIPDPNKRKALWTQYRTEMISQAGIAIFAFGNKLVDGQVVDASGMFEEFEICQQQGLTPIPIGATGYAAKALWDRVMADFPAYVRNELLRSDYEALGKTDLCADDLIKTVVDIVKHLSKP